VVTEAGFVAGAAAQRRASGGFRSGAAMRDEPLATLLREAAADNRQKGLKKPKA